MNCTFSLDFFSFWCSPFETLETALGKSINCCGTVYICSHVYWWSYSFEDNNEDLDLWSQICILDHKCLELYYGFSWGYNSSRWHLWLLFSCFQKILIWKLDKNHHSHFHLHNNHCILLLHLFRFRFHLTLIFLIILSIKKILFISLKNF